MLEFLRDSRKASDRKLRLFAAGCCRLVWPLLADQGSWTAVDLAEQYADGQATSEEMFAASAQSWVDAARGATMADAWEAAQYTSCYGCRLAVDAVDGLSRSRAKTNAIELHKQAGVLHDLFGPWPFRAMPFIAEGVLAWNSGCVIKLAKGIYQDQDFSPERMGVLADALEDAGVKDEDVLGHCRQRGAVHVRGCWLIDLLTGRE
jgi:hypothetical protein